MRARRVPIVLFALVLVAGAAAIWIVRDALEPDPAEPVEAFLTDWEAGRDLKAAARTDSPRVAAAALKANRLGLDDARLDARTLEISENGDRAKARVRLRWTAPAIGPFAYEIVVPVRKDGDEWRVPRTPTLVHPKLEPDTRLGTTRAAFERAPILDRDRVPVVRPRPVVRVGAVVKDVSNPRATADGLARVLDVDRGPILRQLRAGGPEQFVEAIVLRRPDYAAMQAEVEAIPDAAAFDDTAPLAPTREFARGLLGTVAPVTAEQLERLGKGYAPGDLVGQAGLQARYERRLAGTPTRRVLIRTIDGGRPLETLFEREGRAGRALETTLSTPRTGGGRERAGRSRRRSRSGGAGSLERGRAGGGRASGRLGLSPSAGGPLPAGLDLQGRDHGGAAARRAGHRRGRELPADDQRRRPRLSQLRGRRGRRRAL
jgi:hypothetical protein